MNNTRTQFGRKAVVAAALALPLAAVGISCAGTAGAIVGAALNVGANMLNATATNYGADYSNELAEVLSLLRQDLEEGTGLSKFREGVGSRGIVTEGRRGGAAGPLALDVTLLKESMVNGRSTAVEVADGDVLRGDSDLAQGDHLKLAFRANQKCYVYIIGIDGTGWPTPIFPEEGGDALVQAGVGNIIPPDDLWYPLDNYTGVENIYFLASTDRSPQLEDHMATMAGRERPEIDPATATQVTEEAVFQRGVGRKQSGQRIKVKSSTGIEQEAGMTSFVSSEYGIDVVVTRWFRHE